MVLNHPALHGGALALLAAALFGIAIPLVQRAGSGSGPFATAALLYSGAALVGLLTRKPIRLEAALRTSDWPRLTLMAGFGAVLGPVALVWGLQHTSATSASLMLALEALFTAALARAFYGEAMSRGVWAAMLLLFGGGLVLVLDRGFTGGPQLLGLLAVLAATAAWGVDNALSRALAERDPGQVVLGKSALGVTATALLAVLAMEPVPALPSALALLLIGAVGYGLSLRLYLMAQRAIGAGRTGSVFAFAPFIGALLTIALGDRSATWGIAAGGILMLAGVVLHLLESHGHEHQHEALTHEHAHSHDGWHHTHTHDPMPKGLRSHRHTHEPIGHTHPHAPDVHHGHKH